jgi:hypothetical protein
LRPIDLYGHGTRGLCALFCRAVPIPIKYKTA